jgi:hypothetical protein
VKEIETMKSSVKYVALNRAEGPIRECKAIVYYVGDKPQVNGDHYVGAEYVQVRDIFGAVIHQFSNWGISAPERGYDKCDFLVGWENGKDYEGRFDIQKGGVDGHESFWASLKSRLEFYSLRRRPAHFKDATWQHLCKQNRENGWDKECAEFLDECALI